MSGGITFEQIAYEGFKTWSGLSQILKKLDLLPSHVRLLGIWQFYKGEGPSGGFHSNKRTKPHEVDDGKQSKLFAQQAIFDVMQSRIADIIVNTRALHISCFRNLEKYRYFAETSAGYRFPSSSKTESRCPESPSNFTRRRGGLIHCGICRRTLQYIGGFGWNALCCVQICKLDHTFFY